MPYYLVERYLPSLTAGDVAAAVERVSSRPPAFDTTDDMARHVWTVAIADEETCLSLFEAGDRAVVEMVNRVAHFPFDRVIEALLIDGNDR